MKTVPRIGKTSSTRIDLADASWATCRYIDALDGHPGKLLRGYEGRADAGLFVTDTLVHGRCCDMHLTVWRHEDCCPGRNGYALQRL